MKLKVVQTLYFALLPLLLIVASSSYASLVGKKHPFFQLVRLTLLFSPIQSIWSSGKQLPVCQTTTKWKWLCSNAPVHFFLTCLAILMLEGNILTTGVGIYVYSSSLAVVNSLIGLETWRCLSIAPAWVLENPSARNERRGIASQWVIQSYNQNVYSVCVLAGPSVVPQIRIPSNRLLQSSHVY